MNLSKILIIFLIMFLFFSFRYYCHSKDSNSLEKIFYFKINPKIIDNKNLVELILNNGIIKNPKKQLFFNKSSCYIFNFPLLKKYLPDLVSKIYNDQFLDLLRIISGNNDLMFIDPDKDSLSIVVQLYQKDDYMSYHYDTNFTQGERYTVIIPLFINEYNSSFLIVNSKNNEEKIVIELGQGIIYRGTKILHKVSKQSEYGKRVVLIISLTTNINSNYIQKQLFNIRHYLFDKLTL